MKLGIILCYLEKILDFKVIGEGLGGVALMGIVRIGSPNINHITVAAKLGII